MKQCPVCEAWCFEDMSLCYNCMHSFQGMEQQEKDGEVQHLESRAEPDDPLQQVYVAESFDFDQLFEDIDEIHFDQQESAFDGAYAPALEKTPEPCVPQVIRIEVPLSAIRAWAV